MKRLLGPLIIALQLTVGERLANAQTEEPNLGAPATPPAAGPTPTPGPTPAAGPTPAGDDDETMTFHARPTSMQEFAEGSLQEIHIGKAKMRYALNLFGDATFGAASAREGGLPPDPAFATGVFDMLFNAQLHEKLRATSEITFAYDPTAPVAALERLHVRWTPNKYFFLEAGRFHTDIGYWNVAYHHGKWLQLPIERPRQIQLHGGLLPTHWIGAQAGISIPVGDGALNLVSSVGSARDPAGNAATHGGANHATTPTPVNGVHAKLELADVILKDLRFGVSGVYDRVAAEGAPVRPILPDLAFDEYVGNVYVAHMSFPFTLIAEGYEVLHLIPKGDVVGANGGGAALAGGRWRTYGAFALIGYTIGVVTPYVKGEYITVKTTALVADPFYVPERNPLNPPTYALDLVEGAVGARFDLSTWCALKLEYRLTTGQAQRFAAESYPAIHTAAANWSFGI